MRWRLVGAVVVTALAAALRSTAAGPPSPLTDADRKLFAWFDGIGLPSCAGKPYVRVEWTRDGASATVPDADDVWTVDGFLVSESPERLTVLDGDLWPRRIDRTPTDGWKGGVRTLELRRVVAAALGRLRALRSDPGAVEGMDELYPGVRLRFGDEAQSMALARHAAEHGLDREARALLEAARALPPLPDAGASSFEQVVARQLDEGVIWRVHIDATELPRAQLLARLRGWRASFPASPHVARADTLLDVLPAMVEEDTAHPAVADAELARLPTAERTRELVRRLRDQPGDVAMGRDGRVTLDLGPASSPAGQLRALGLDAAPALVDAVADARLTRAVLFVRDLSFRRVVVARVGDVARVLLEALAKEPFWDPPEDQPSMFQHGAQQEVAERCRTWLATAVPTPSGAPK